MATCIVDSDDSDFEPDQKRSKTRVAFKTTHSSPLKKSRSAAVFHCPEDGCDYSFSRTGNLQRHLKEGHGHDSGSTTGRFICQVSNCGKAFFHASKLVEHYPQHGIQISTERKEFPSWEGFLSWKQLEEETSHACFVQPKGGENSHTQQLEFQNLLYTCCRDGIARENKHPRKTEKKRKCLKGSRKLENSYCLARLYVKHHQSTGRVEVAYISTHTNHSLGLEECKYLPLPLSLRKEIQEKFAQGVTLERIMDDIRADLGKRQQRHVFDELATRRHFITRQDCRNACRKVRNFTRHRHDNDAVSVDRIVRELQLEDPSPVIAYKPRGVTSEKYPLLAEDNFLLILMTEYQATLFLKFSTLLCVDSTHKTNEYGYKLMSMVVADEFRNGQPIAWAITDTEDTNSYQEFFKAVKSRVPEATIKTLMTDDDNAIVGACTNVYSGVTHLLCRWHVDSHSNAASVHVALYRAWQKKLHTLVRDDGHKAEIYKYLWMLMSEGDPALFLQNMEAFQTFWKRIEPGFISYFKDYYANRVEKWALAYRHFEHKDTDTNMLVESFHNKLKTNPRYLNHNVNRRCDDLIEVLLAVEVDMFYDRKRKEVMSSTTEASKKVEGDRHARGQSIEDLKVHTQEEGRYLVDSATTETQYIVEVLSSTCPDQPNCLPHCVEKECSYLCRHMISCTCYDFQHGHLCKHTHKVYHCHLQLLPENEGNAIMENTTDPQEIGITPPKAVQDEAALQEKRSVIKTYLKEIQGLVEETGDGSVLDHIQAKLLPVFTTLRAHLESPPEEPSQQLQDFDVTDKFAPAQKNEKQLRFDKVKSKKNKNKFPLKHPTPEQQQILQQQLKDTTPEENRDSCNQENHKQPKGGSKRRRCGTCSGCAGDDCGSCQFCRDMQKFGGPGRKKRCCVKRKCLNLTLDENTTHALKDVTNHLTGIVDSFRHTIDTTKANPLRSFTLPTITSQTQTTTQQLCLSKAIWQMEVAIALQVPTEAKLCLNPHINQPAADSTSARILPVLHSQGRTVDVMLPDGSCLFRALSKALFAVQSGHTTLRHLLVKFAESNDRQFGGLCNGTLQSHCARMREPTTFGTQAELQAAASLLQVCIYIFHKPTEKRDWKWMYYKPHNKESLLYSDISIPEAPRTFRIEILYDEQRSHFDLIVPQESQLILSPPQLLGTSTTTFIDLS